MSYKEFSYYYDYFNYNADYDVLADKIHSWASAEKLDGKIACDLGCGTGELAIRLNEIFFFAKVVDKTALKVSLDDYSFDKSVKGEFVRLVAESNLDSETKKRVLTYGLNALKGEM